MKRSISISFSILLLFIVFSLCSCRAKAADIAGKWETVADYNGESVSLSWEFFEDGTGRHEMEGFSADSFTYETSEGKVTLTVGSESREMSYSIEKNMLVLEIEGQSILFEKTEK